MFCFIGTVYTESRVADVVDKKSGALLIIGGRSPSPPPPPFFSFSSITMLTYSAETKTEGGEVVAINQFSVFIIGAGGFGGKRQSPALKVNNFVKVICGFYYFLVFIHTCSQL